MRLSLLLLLTLLKLPTGGPPAVRVTFSPLTKAAYLEAAKGVVQTETVRTFPLKKLRGRIIIPTAKGPKAFQDKGVGTDNDDQVEFTYRGYAADVRYHSVSGVYWEGFLWHLVGDNGQVLELANRPEYSADKRSFVVWSAGIEIGYVPNSIQLFRLENGRWRQIWKIEPLVDPMS